MNENLLTIESKIDGGFPFKVTTPPFQNLELQYKLQRAVNIASQRLQPMFLKSFIDNFSFSYPIYKRRWFRRVQVGTKTSNTFHVDTPSDIFNCSKKDMFKIVNNGNELVLGEGSDGEADVFWKLNPRSKRGVVGYTYANTVWQWTYLNWARNMSDEELAGHLVHEWLHKLGGKHSYKSHALRKYTFVYACGYYVGGRY